MDTRIFDILIKMKLTHHWDIINFLKECGYDSNEIKEVYEYYFESISHLEFTPLNWLKYYYGNLTPKKSDTFYDMTFYYSKNYGIEHKQIEDDMRYWLKETLNIEGNMSKITFHNKGL